MAEKKSTDKSEKLEKIEKVEKTEKEKPVRVKETAKAEPMLTEFEEYKEKIKDWYETDSAKATATVIAILLIPGAVLAWNYFSQQDNVRTKGLIGDEGQSTSIYDEKNDSNGTTFTEMFQNDSDSNTNEMEITPKPTSVDLLTDITNNGMNTSITDNGQNTNTSQSENPSIDEVKKLPNTSSAIYYKVRRGDNYYKISRKICGTELFYKKNISHNYLPVGKVIRVTCY